MFSLPPKGRRALFIVHDPKLHAWSLRIGHQYPQTGGPNMRRPHRGMLPDVDFTRVVPDAGYRSLFRRIVDLIRRERRSREPEPDPDASVPGSSAPSVGKSVRTFYDSPLQLSGRTTPARTETEDSEARAA